MKQLDPATHDRHVRGKKHAIAKAASKPSVLVLAPKICARLLWLFVKIRTREAAHMSKLAKVIAAQLIDHHCHIELSIRSPKFVS